jgi:hypothetical protein
MFITIVGERFGGVSGGIKYTGHLLNVSVRVLCNCLLVESICIYGPVFLNKEIGVVMSWCLGHS